MFRLAPDDVLSQTSPEHNGPISLRHPHPCELGSQGPPKVVTPGAGPLILRRAWGGDGCGGVEGDRVGWSKGSNFDGYTPLPWKLEEPHAMANNDYSRMVVSDAGRLSATTSSIWACHTERQSIHKGRAQTSLAMA